MFWANKITLVNQTAIPASVHGYRMAAVNNNKTVALYGESIANFRAPYATTQESVKTQGTRHHPRVSQDPRHDDCNDADPAAGNAPVLHGPAATAPPPPAVRAPQ